MSTPRRLFHFALRHRRIAALQLTLAIMGTLLMPIFPGVTQWFFDNIIPNRRTDLIATAALLMFGGFAGMAVTMMAHTNAALTWIALTPTPFLAAGGLIYTRLLSPRAMQARVATSAMNAMLFDTIAGIRQIKSYSFEEEQQGHFNSFSLRLQRVQNTLMAASAIYSPLMTLIGKVGLVLVMFIGARWCMNGSDGGIQALTQGELLAFILLVGMLYEPIARLHGVNQMMMTGLACASRVFAVLDESGEEDLQAGLTLGAVRREVVFDKVNFSYVPGRPVVSNISLRVEPQQTVAFVGATGSGKSTLFQLLSRFYDPGSGTISFDGRIVTDYSKASVRDAIAYVTQDAFLFSTTIRENLLLGKADASEPELWDALQLACADDFVRRITEGLDSEVGERGARLSGGERQRLSMARAFLKNAPILLLDEATSAVDNKSEQLIQESLQKLRQNRTCLVIAHRLSTAVEADRIYVMRLGEIVGSGTHEQLLRSSPYYAELAALAFDTQRKPTQDGDRHVRVQ